MWVETDLFTPLVAVTEVGVCFLALTSDRAERGLAEWMERQRPSGDAGDGLLRSAAEQLREVAAGRRQVFDLPLDLRGTQFQRTVWAELQRIPFGKTRTYGELARRIGRGGASRAVGGANGANPVSWVVP
jgi:O6-methylguanine-DNA--protein-cysteine methyltransferase